MIYLIAGHRGKETGAIGIIDEGAEASYLRDDIADELRSRGVDVLCDRDSMTLREVVNDANAKCGVGDLIVDLHFNAYNGKAEGTEVLISKRASLKTRTRAEQICRAVCEALGTKSRGVKTSGCGQHSRLAILDDTRCRAVLVEICFCDNRGDTDKFVRNRERLIQAFVEELLNR